MIVDFFEFLISENKFWNAESRYVFDGSSDSMQYSRKLGMDMNPCTTALR